MADHLTDLGTEPVIADALRAVRAAEKGLAATLKQICPEGSLITWKHHERTCFGRVVMVGSEKVRVVNDRTGKDYWIYAYAVTNVISKPPMLAERAKNQEQKQ